MKHIVGNGQEPECMPLKGKKLILVSRCAWTLYNFNAYSEVAI